MKVGQDNRKLNLWQETLEFKSFRFNRNKTEYVRWDFNTTTQGDVSLKGQEMPKEDNFRYLGSMLRRDREIGVLIRC
jgi:hypothetical protein